VKSPESGKREIPREIGGYRIIDMLGEGGMSVVYTAMQAHPQRKVAVKVLRGGSYMPTATRRFRQEVEILGQLDHPWIAKVYDAGSHDDGTGGMPFLVMEYIPDAQELTDYLDAAKIDRRDELKLFAMICSAVEHGHQRGVVHRDLKPGNILITTQGEPKVIDFGVARSTGMGNVGEEAITEAGRLVGTVQFMAPEQVDPRIQDIDARCDVYALGAILYRMLTGHLPRSLEGLPIYEAVRMISEEEPARPTTHDGTIDSNLEAIVMHALAQDRDKRYQTAGALGRDIVRYLADMPIKARHVGSMDRLQLFLRRNRRPVLVWGSLVIVAAGAAGFVWWKQDASASQLGKLQDELRTAREAPAPPEGAEQVSLLEERFSLGESPLVVSVSEDGTTLAAALASGIVAWRLDGGRVPLPPNNIDTSDISLALSANATRLIIADSGPRVRIADLEQRQPMKRIERRPGRVEALVASGAMIAIATDDMAMQVLDPRNAVRRAQSSTGTFDHVAFAPNRRHLVATSSSWMSTWDMAAFPRSAQRHAGPPETLALAWKGDSTVLAFGRDASLVTHELGAGSSESTMLPLPVVIDLAAFNGDGSVLGCLGDDRLFRVDIASGEVAEVPWDAEEVPVGVAVDDKGGIVAWTAAGGVYR
jgi:hypothetical protein